MSLSHLIKHIYNNASEEVIRRGKKIHQAGNLEVIDHNPLLQTINFRIKDDLYSTWYKVKVDNYNDPRGLTLRCTCPYNISEVCRHKAAALMQLQEKADNGTLEGGELRYNQRHTQAKMKLIDLKMIRMLAGNDNYEAALEILRSHKANILKASNETVDATLVYGQESFTLRLRKNEERFFDTSCTCLEEDHVLCKHKTTLFLQLLNAYGPQYFDTIRNYDREKEKLLGLYGYSLKDELAGKFEFIYKEGKPFLKLLDPSIQRISSPLQAPELPAYRQPVVPVIPPPPIPVSKQLGLVFTSNDQTYPWFSIEGVQGELSDTNSMIGLVEKLDLTRFINLEVFEEEDRQMIHQLRKLSDTEVNKFLNRNSPFSGIWDNIVHTNGSDLPEETRQLINDYLHPKLLRLFQDMEESDKIYWLPPQKKLLTGNLVKIRLVATMLSPRFTIQPNKNRFEVKCQVTIDDNLVDLTENEWSSPLLFLYQGKLYGWEKPEDVGMAEFFGKLEPVHAADWPAFAQKFLVDLARDYPVKFDKSLVREIKDTQPEIELQLLEKGDFLVFQPIFSYLGVQAPNDEQASITMVKDGEIWITHRLMDKERQFFKKLESLHTNFIRPERGRQLVLKGTDVLRNNWFFLFMETMQEMQVPVLGFNHLKNFRFNQARPSTHIRISSGVDWFDANVDVSFGDQKVRISDLKEALSGKQTVVPLGDGTLGILPQEWLTKYALLFKVGEGKSNSSLRLSKYQFSVIDELYEQRDNEELEVVLEEKFDRLRSFRKIRKVSAPSHLRSTLRPYQVTGFHWLNFLQETGCGGILADDMGLGKTIQALTMLEHFENTTGNLKALVVCPTTLLYNWENEIKKFTPQLEYFIHHGGQRSRNVSDLAPHHIIITTYGTLRSDIILLQQIAFDYVILDESQAIKNPNSKVTKASCLINAKHRLCMSGTPLQNNTFDIYAQMNFLNPGLLGNAEFFRNEFATPIDKFGEQEQKLHLRKLLYPFILRRTKEQVAKDLPEKTETILFCEMEKEQRTIYDAFRNDFRDKVLGAIDTQGIERSQLTILQGLMKLRQICDSPAIMKEPEPYPNHSIKLEELTREITENISDHKALVFSQFLGMLGLIREKLKELNVPYEYFDGSTAVGDRQKAIDNFQNNSECRVFLISLKAGGVGLNLTAADYVYIVDPWWNPAVEQQAIDRTHRIGQTRNIIAYRMICKDTVEDKIIQLQERKRLLAKELISDDAGFVKKLTRQDVEYLFS